VEEVETERLGSPEVQRLQSRRQWSYTELGQ
jgi:hypothetical protein